MSSMEPSLTASMTPDSLEIAQRPHSYTSSTEQDRSVPSFPQRSTIHSQNYNDYTSEEIIYSIPRPILPNRNYLDNISRNVDQKAIFNSRMAAKNLFEGSNDLLKPTNNLLEGKNNLLEGTNNLYNGRKKLSEGTNNLLDVRKNLLEGRGNLLDGRNNLSEETDNLSEGTDNLFKGKSNLLGGNNNLLEGNNNLLEGTNNVLRSKNLSEGEPNEYSTPFYIDQRDSSQYFRISPCKEGGVKSLDVYVDSLEPSNEVSTVF